MIVDCDFQAQWATMARIAPHLDPSWRDYLRLGPSGETVDPAVQIGLPASVYSVPSSPLLRAGADDAREAALGFLDRAGIDRAILNAGAAGAVSGISSPVLATALARAVNDWLAREWLDVDERLLASVVVAPHDGRAAAAEVRRVAEDPRVVQVVLAQPPGFLGNRGLFPLFEAAAELELPVCFQASGTYTGANRGLTGAGFPTTTFENEVNWAAGAQPHLVSLIAEGAFERLPGLRVVFAGFGAAWLPSVLWRLDDEYRGGRTKPPRWIERLPSDYVREHVRVTTARLELPERSERLFELLALADAAGLLLYASGCEGRDDRVTPSILDGFPAEWRSRILGAEARDLYRLDAAPVGPR
jgi:predicted TIM-barrel fold metal-dependent hydrolase